MVEKIEIENVGQPGKVYRVEAEKFSAMKAAVLAALPPAPPGMSVSDLIDAVKSELPQDLFPGGDKAGWWVKAVQLDLEAKKVIARADKNGVEHSTPAERATVAELWVNRKWSLLQSWKAVTPQAWTAPGIPPADGDIARTSVVEAGRAAVEKLTPLLKDNGVEFAYPLLVWWTEDGEMHACACEAPQTYRKVRRELGA